MVDFSQAKSVDIVWYLSQHGYTPVRETSRSAYYLSPLRSESAPSFHVDRVKNRWADWGFAKEDKMFGDLSDLVSEIEGCSLKEAVCKIVGGEDIKRYHKEVDTSSRQNNIEIEEEKDGISNEYLIEYIERTRNIPIEIVNKYCTQVKLRFASSAYAAHYMIGLKNDLGGYAIRNHFFKGSTKPASISTLNYSQVDEVSCFEGFIDYLSYEAMFGELGHTVIVLNSLVFIPMIKDVLRGYGMVNMRLDNDGAADDKLEYLRANEIDFVDQRYSLQGFKDWNELLVNTYSF
jgi:hypothetical protein